MKKVLIVLPFAALLANCGSSHNAATSASSASSPSTAAVAGTSATGTASASTSAAEVAWNSDAFDLKSYVPGPETGYDPNNYTQNPEKYIPAYMLVKTGGWTYNTDWQRNKNFAKEAEGSWQLVVTPETATSWIRDTSRPETYASYWTPEAVAARQEIMMMAAAKTADSLATLDSIAMIANAPAKSGKNKSGKYAKTQRRSAGVNGSATAGTSATGDVSTTASVTGSGTTGEMGTGGMAATASTDAATAASTYSVLDASGALTSAALTAVNGNKFLLPTINLHVANGSFTAYTGCNDAIGTLTMNGNKLHFTQTAPLSSIQCIGGFDQAAFIDRLSRADNYDIVNNQFRFKQGEEVLMVFAKPAQ